MKSTVKTVKGRGRPKGSKNKAVKVSNAQVLEKWSKYVKDFNEWAEDVESDQLAQLEKDLERKDHTLEIMRDEIRELEKQVKDQKEKNAFLELDISHLKDIIKRLVEHL